MRCSPVLGDSRAQDVKSSHKVNRRDRPAARYGPARPDKGPFTINAVLGQNCTTVNGKFVRPYERPRQCP